VPISLSEQYRADVAECGVHIRYPYSEEAVDESWLASEAECHGGQLSEAVFLSNPLQRLGEFPDEPSALAFVSSLTASGRWHACVRGKGCPGW